jgi:hypothetical protein
MHCPVCGFIMMIEISEDKTNYVCVNPHNVKNKDEYGLGPNLDLLLEYLKRP